MSNSRKLVHLHGHSERGSVLDACASIPRIVARAKKNGAPAIALTEHGTMASFVEFYYECKKNNIKPILGVEAYLVDNKNIKGLTDEEKEHYDNLIKQAEQLKDQEEVDRLKLEKKQEGRKRLKNYHIGIIAMNNTGLRNLFKIVTDANMNGFYGKPRTDLETIEKYNEGLILLSGCTSSRFNSYIGAWPKITEDDEGEKSQVTIIDDIESASSHLLKLKSIFGECLGV
jgi:DNA polymerase-3 subunit alpha